MRNVAKALEDGSLDEDPFLREYRAKRMEELKQQASAGSRRSVGGAGEGGRGQWVGLRRRGWESGWGWALGREQEVSGWDWGGALLWSGL